MKIASNAPISSSFDPTPFFKRKLVQFHGRVISLKSPLPKQGKIEEIFKRALTVMLIPFSYPLLSFFSLFQKGKKKAVVIHPKKKKVQEEAKSQVRPLPPKNKVKNWPTKLAQTKKIPTTSKKTPPLPDKRKAKKQKIAPPSENLPLFAPIQKSGISNGGNNCFMNTALQIFAHIRPFRDFLNSDEGVLDPQFKKEVAHIVQNLNQGGNVLPEQSRIRNLFFKNQKDGKKENGCQQDASDFLRALMEKIGGKMPELPVKKTYSIDKILQSHPANLKDQSKDLTLFFAKKFQRKETIELQPSLAMFKAIRKNHSKPLLDHLLEAFNEKTLIQNYEFLTENEGEVYWNQGILELTTEMEAELPQVIAINLSKIYPHQRPRFSYPLRWKPEGQDHTYVLEAVAHKTGSIRGGHWKAFLRESENIYLVANDADISRKPANALPLNQGTLFYYVREDFSSSNAS